MIRHHLNYLDQIQSQIDRSFAAIETWMGSGDTNKIKKELGYAK